MPFPTLSTDALNKCSVGELQVSRKGQKYAEIKFNGEQANFQLSSEALFSPFNAGVYQGTGSETRVNLDLQINDALKPVLEAYDNFFEAEIKKLAPKASYHRLVQEHGDYPARLRLKVNTFGLKAARMWKPDQSLIGGIKDCNGLAGTRIIAIASPVKVWVMGGSAGVCFELKHGIVYEADISNDIFPLI